MLGRFDQQPTGVGIARLGDRSLHSGGARGLLGGYQPEVGAGESVSVPDLHGQAAPHCTASAGTAAAKGARSDSPAYLCSTASDVAAPGSLVSAVTLAKRDRSTVRACASRSTNGSVC